MATVAMHETPPARGKPGKEVDALLSSPPESLALENETQVRLSASYDNKDARFLLSEKKYQQQFAQIYFNRLMLMTPLLQEAISKKWPGVPASKILNVEEDKECVVVGTIYKQMKLKPSILDEYTQELTVKPSVAPSKFTDADDFLVMEDEGARMKLSGDCLIDADLATGVVIAVRGKDVGDEFQAEDICFPAAAPQGPLPDLGGDSYVALVSGLGAGGGGSPLMVQMLVDFLSGMLGNPDENSLGAKVVRTIVAGDTLSGVTGEQLMQPVVGGKRQEVMVSPVKEMDMLLTELAAAMPVDVMPGAGDATNYSLPQQPLHRCLLPSLTSYSTSVRATNPHEFAVGGVGFLGTSGQAVSDLYRYCDGEDRLDLMENTLRWRHVAPTAPDTLACYPFHDRDPFVIQEQPHVYFAGNQPKLQTRMMCEGDSRTLLVCLPKFCETGTAVLVNLRTLDCHPITFGLPQ